MEEVFSDFKLHERVSEKTLIDYENVLPKEIISLWVKYGFGSFLEGYLKLINPKDYIDILKDGYARDKQSIPIFTTSMGDIIILEKGKYVNLLCFRKGFVHVIASGFDFFIDDLKDEAFLKDELFWEPYIDAVKRTGKPAYDECFGYTPLLGLGGVEKVEHLKKVKLKEHMLIITELLGPIR